MIRKSLLAILLIGILLLSGCGNFTREQITIRERYNSCNSDFSSVYITDSGIVYYSSDWAVPTDNDKPMGYNIAAGTAPLLINHTYIVHVSDNNYITGIERQVN